MDQHYSSLLFGKKGKYILKARGQANPKDAKRREASILFFEGKLRLLKYMCVCVYKIKLQKLLIFLKRMNSVYIRQNYGLLYPRKIEKKSKRRKEQIH